MEPNTEPNTELPVTKNRSRNQKPKKPIFWFGSAQFSSVYGFFDFFPSLSTGQTVAFGIKNKDEIKKVYENKDK
jgi:hypothetical protein